MNFNSFFFIPPGMFKKKKYFESSSKTCLCATAAHGDHRGFWFWLLLKTWPYQDFKLLPGPFLKGIIISVFLNSIFRKMNPVIKPLTEVTFMNQSANTEEAHVKRTSHNSSDLAPVARHLTALRSHAFHRESCFQLSFLHGFTIFLNYHIVFWFFLCFVWFGIFGMSILFISN